jgi:hypothetical protein
LLEQEGNTVRPLGTKIIGGVRCTGYSVTPSRKAMIAAARQEIAANKFPAGLAQLDMGIVETTSPPVYTVWFDENELMRQLSVNLRLGGTTSSASGDLVMNFANYGAPVRITAPAPSDTLSYDKFLKTLRTKITISP